MHPLFFFSGYSQGDGLDVFQFHKILLNNSVNEGDFYSVTCLRFRSFFIFPTVNAQKTVGDDGEIHSSTEQFVPQKQQFLPSCSQEIQHPNEKLGKTAI